mgnify:CR=1 FL=1
MSAILINFAPGNVKTWTTVTMKLKNLIPLLFLSLGAFGFVACGDDEESTPQRSEYYEYNKQVAGTYQGWTNLKTTYLDRNYTGDTFTLVLAENGTLTGTFTDAIWGTATITGINAEPYYGVAAYGLKGGEGSFVMNNPRDPENPTQTFPCKLESATFKAEGNELTAVISAYMEVGHGDMTFTFQTGEMPSDN